jgi:hypothetical protein
MVGKKELVKILKENDKPLLLLDSFKKNKLRYFSKKEGRELLKIAEIALEDYKFLQRKKIPGRPKIYTPEENKQRNKDRLNKVNLFKRLAKNKAKI